LRAAETIEHHQKRWLDQGKIGKLVASLRSIRVSDADLAKKIRNEADCFDYNAVLINYRQFRQQHLFFGSGVIEATARPSSAIASNSPECSGPSRAPRPSLHSGALTSTVASRTTGRAAERPNLHFCVAHP
jgi:hypothetical protein